MQRLLSRVFEDLTRAGIEYCLLRDADQLDQFDRGGEVDLLVRPDHLNRFQGLVARLGFVTLPNLGHAPHSFFLAYDQDSDTWLKLDVVTEIAYGRPVHALRTSLGIECLRSRRVAGPVFIPSPEHELVTLLLHCLLDKGRFSASRQARIATLLNQVKDDSRFRAMLAECLGPAVSWPELADLIGSGDWDAVLRIREQALLHLTRKDRVGALGRRVRDRVLRKLSTWSAWLFPRSPAVALLAPDGAGKSTLAQSLGNSFWFPVRSVYMGLYQKRAGRPGRVARLPGIGLLVLLITQWVRYVTARYHQARGRLVIFDRYAYDALLPSRRRLSWLKQLRRKVLGSACPAPDLIVVLDAPGEVLFGRKGEHNPDILEQQRQGYLRLRQRFPRLTVVDTTDGPDRVRREVTRLIWHSYAKRLRRGNPQ